ncbi:MAG: hypothetical protein ACI4GY_08010 [Acutalibacteraceae bacterium]
MKIAYRIVTPILALGSIAMGIFLKMFYFTIGSTDDSIGTLINAVSQISNGKFSTTYEYSVFELIKMISTAKPAADAEDPKTFTEICSAIMPHLISFFVVMALVVLVLIAIAVISAALSDSRKKRYTVISLSAAGLVLLFVCILITNAAFSKIIAGEISLTDLVTLVSDSSIAALATAIVSVTSATLSAGFYAMFGMFMVLIIWTIVTNMIIKTPIQITKKYRRKKPHRKLSALRRG